MTRGMNEALLKAKNQFEETAKNRVIWLLDNFDFVKILARGGEGIVVKAVERESDYPVALVGAVFTGSMEIPEMHVSSVNHPGIVKIYGYFIDKDSDVAPGELRAHIAPAYPDEPLFSSGYNTRSMFLNCAPMGLCMILSRPRGGVFKIRMLPPTRPASRKPWPISAPNILVADDGYVKICDLGASSFDPKLRRQTMIGTLGCMAPEVFRMAANGDLFGNLYYNEKVDSFSLGVLLYHMLTDELPFDPDFFWPLSSGSTVSSGNSTDPDYEEEPVIGKLLITDPEPLPSIHFSDHVSDGAEDLIRQLLHADQAERMSVQDVLAHSCVKKCT
jgi:serine/threonine protein kinase